MCHYLCNYSCPRSCPPSCRFLISTVRLHASVWRLRSRAELGADLNQQIPAGDPIELDEFGQPAARKVGAEVFPGRRRCIKTMLLLRGLTTDDQFCRCAVVQVLFAVPACVGLLENPLVLAAANGVLGRHCRSANGRALPGITANPVQRCPGG